MAELVWVSDLAVGDKLVRTEGVHEIVSLSAHNDTVHVQVRVGVTPGGHPLTVWVKRGRFKRVKAIRAESSDLR